MKQKLLDQLLSDKRLTDPRWVAYIMATVKHETNNTFAPVEEAYWLSDEWRFANLRYAPWWGRGFVQITWKANYEKMSHRLDIPRLATHPDEALNWDTSYEILVIGMLEGLFTGRDLDDFINEEYCDYYRARKIVNGMDKARLIAGYAREYEQQIRALGTRFTDEPPPLDEVYPGCSSIRLREGGSGPCVERLQRALNIWSKVGIFVANGVFCRLTRAVVVQFQLHHDLRDDGIVGPNTWKALEPYL